MAEKLTKDLNIIQRSGIEITVDPITADLNIIQKLDDEPNDVGGLSAAQLKAKFDEAGNTIKAFINDSLIPQVVGADATEAERAAAEAQRVANETARETAETARAEAEAQRQVNEAARVAAETARETDFQASQAERAAAFDQAQAERAETFAEDEAARNFWEDYDPTHTYVPGNKVYYLGSSYVNTSGCQGVLPTVEANWRMIAKKGADSDEGMSQEEADLRYLQLSGGVMTGGVEVMAPTKDTNPATKAYVDAAEAAAENYADEAEEAAKAYADGLRQETLGDVYTREQCLTAETAALYPGLPENPVPDDVLAKIPGIISAGWKKIRAFEVAGTYTWVAPDYFNGKSYRVGFIAVGGGQGGSCGILSGSNNSYIYGGHSGGSVYGIIDVSPGTAYSVVVGAKGAGAKIVNGTSINYQKNGGTSAFNGVSTNYNTGQMPIPTSASSFGGFLYVTNTPTVAGNSLSCFNPFECKQILGSGGCVSGNSSSPYISSPGIDPLTNTGGGTAVLGTYDSTSQNIYSAQNATAPGCGGGAASMRYPGTTYTLTAGDGRDGFVYLYVMGR